MATKLADEVKGYQYFLENLGKPSLKNINEFLERSGHNPISQKTYARYKDQIRRGKTSYVPMAAQLEDAIKGYDYYLENRGKPSLEKVRKFLENIGRIPISQRTFGHYKKLMRFGFRSYIPINQFDVSRTRGQLQMVADRRRYSREVIETWIMPQELMETNVTI